MVNPLFYNLMQPDAGNSALSSRGINYANPDFVILKYEEVVPSLALREYIECYWTLVSDCSLENELCLPDGSASLIFNFGLPYRRAVCHRPNEWMQVGRHSLVHQNKASVLINQQSPVRMLGVRFKPYGMAPFFKVNMNQYPPPFILNGSMLFKWLGSLKEKLWETDCFSERTALVDHDLLRRLPNTPPPDPLVKESVSIMVKNRGVIKIGDLLEQLCVSKSNLEKKFQEHVGLSPKILCNIFRFNSIVYNHQMNPVPSLTELSYKQGFFDQSHLVHNFRSFTGLPPGKFFRQENLLVEMLRQSFEARTMEIY
ncbi:MAG TPA: AraC family transcriptional regulator [Bacteroidetes bacterium]|nr:AraC family transcriptional regulator [Bacteroidota bacterium]